MELKKKDISYQVKNSEDDIWWWWWCTPFRWMQVC